MLLELAKGADWHQLATARSKSANVSMSGVMAVAPPSLKPGAGAYPRQELLTDRPPRYYCRDNQPGRIGLLCRYRHDADRQIWIVVLLGKNGRLKSRAPGLFDSLALA